MKFLAIHITNQKLSFDIFTVGHLQNIFMDVMPWGSENAHTHTIIASTFLRLKELLSSLSASRKNWQMNSTSPNWLADFLPCYRVIILRKPLKTRRALRETSANGPATNFMDSLIVLRNNSMMVSTRKTVLREKSECWSSADARPNWLLDLPSSPDIPRKCAFLFFNRTRLKTFLKCSKKTINNNHCCY